MKQLIILKENQSAIKEAKTLFQNIKKIDIDYKQENFIVFYLDTRNKLIDSEVLFKGGLNACVIDLKTIFRKALLNNSCSIIIAHNHPSGDLNPSDEDKEIYLRLKEAGELLTLKCLDSIIFNKNSFFSLNGDKK